MDRDRYYEVLGLASHASAEELKNAYRDLAKVWHPDRFAHDPRLQQKAQEKLKEINEAYKELTSGGGARRRHPRGPSSAPPPHAPRRTHAHGAGVGPQVVIVRERRSSSAPLVAVALVAAVVGVALFAGYRLMKRTPAPVAANSQASDAGSAGDGQPEEAAAGVERRERKSNTRQRAEGEAQAAGPSRQTDAPPDTAVAATVRGLPTVNRTIDPTTGLLAARACPLKLLRTYPAGQEPQQYCTADHTTKRASEAHAPDRPAPSQADAPASAQTQTGADGGGGGKSRLRSALGTAVSPGKWFRKKKEKPAGQ